MNEFGHSFEMQNTLFYFGNKNLKETALTKHFPNFSFKKNKQVHSNIVIEAEQSPKEADGLWTTQKNTALIAVTADCVPILLSNGKKAFSLHAGWRGVASDIVGSAFENLTQEERNTNWTAYIGPHIQFESFDIKADTLKPLTEAWKAVSPKSPPAKQIAPEQWRFDLYSLVFAQLQFYFRDKIEIHRLDFDTKQNPLFNSFRRDKGGAGRNFSFVVLKGT